MARSVTLIYETRSGWAKIPLMYHSQNSQFMGIKGLRDRAYHTKFPISHARTNLSWCAIIVSVWWPLQHSFPSALSQISRSTHIISIRHPRGTFLWKGSKIGRDSGQINAILPPENIPIPTYSKWLQLDWRRLQVSRTTRVLYHALFIILTIGVFWKLTPNGHFLLQDSLSGRGHLSSLCFRAHWVNCLSTKWEPPNVSHISMCSFFLSFSLNHPCLSLYLSQSPLSLPLTPLLLILPLSVCPLFMTQHTNIAESG